MTPDVFIPTPLGEINYGDIVSVNKYYITKEDQKRVMCVVLEKTRMTLSLLALDVVEVSPGRLIDRFIVTAVSGFAQEIFLEARLVDQAG